MKKDIKKLLLEIDFQNHIILALRKIKKKRVEIIKEAEKLE